MFGIGMPELIMILIIALVVIGPKKLPELANSLGRALGEFKKATGDLKETLKVDNEFEELKDLKNTFEDMGKTSGETKHTNAASSEASNTPPMSDNSNEAYAQSAPNPYFNEDSLKDDGKTSEDAGLEEKTPEKTDDPKKETV